MKTSANDLVDVLESVSPGLASRELIEQSTSFIFLPGKVCTYNDDVSVVAPVDCDFKCAVPSDPILAILHKLKDTEVTLTLARNKKDKTTELLITGKRISSGIRVEKDVRLPIESVGVPEKGAKVPSGLKDALEFCAFTTSSDQTRPILTCVHVNGTTVQACDNYRIMRFEMDEPMPKACSEMLVPVAVVKKLAGYEIVRAALTDSWMHFFCKGGVILSCRRLVEKYPDVSHLLKVKGKSFSFVQKTENMLDRAAVFTRVIESELDESVEVKIQDGLMQVVGKGDLGWYKESAKCDFTGDAFSFMVHPRFLREIIDQTRKAVVSERFIKFSGKKFTYVAALVS